VVTSRKPHLLRVKRHIVSILDSHVDKMRNDGIDSRELAIWIRQRNKIAKDADIPVIPLTEKDGQGKIIYSD
jgi:hypothetical protein